MLRGLKSQRTVLQKKIKQELQKAENLLKEEKSAQDDISSCVRGLGVSRSVLSSLQIRFDLLSDKILEHSDSRTDEEIDNDSELTVEVATEIAILFAEMDSFISQLPISSAKVADNLSSSPEMERLQQKIDKLVELQTLDVSGLDGASSFVSEGAVARSRPSVRLPKLEFEKFSGDLLKFQEFWDSFDAAIDSNSSLRPVEKLNYLRAYLSGDAKNTISGISTSDVNYAIAVELIKNRFGNPQASIDAHYSHLMNLSPASNQTSRIRSFYDDVERHLRCLSALGEDIEHRHFISLIMSKLPKDVLIHLEQGKELTECWSVGLLRTKLQSLLTARETAERQQCQMRPHEERSFSRNLSFPANNMSSFRHSKDRKSPCDSTVGGLVAGERLSSKATAKCILCDGLHFSDQCLKFKSVEDRKRRLRGRCFICLRTDHKFPECQSTKPCFYCRKMKKHHRCLCPAKFSGPTETSAVTADLPTSGEGKDPQCTVLASGDSVLLQTATVTVQSPKGDNAVNTRVLLDCASNRSYISTSLAQRLGIKSTESESFSVVTFGSEKPKTVTTAVAKVRILLKDGSSKTLDVNIVKKITGTIYRHPVSVDQSSFLWKNLPLADTLPSKKEKSAVDFLIGNDYYLELITAEKIEIGKGLFLLGSTLGWILSGRIEHEKNHDPNVALFVSSFVNGSVSELAAFSTVDESAPLKRNFEDYWSLESIGITEKPDESDDDKALETFNANVKIRNKRYEVSWPWRDSCCNLSENYELALGRFKSLLKKFQADASLFQKYGDIIKDQEVKGIIEKVTGETQEITFKHYLPHHPVVNQQKSTTKVRIVYDASAKTKKGSSLNECLRRGPVILEDLCGLLIRFRLHPVAIIADIEKAFLQIGLQDEDRDVTRFFWLKDSLKPYVEDNLQVYRFCRVPFGVISSPFLLAATVRYHLLQETSQAARKICGNLYVDNLVTGANNASEASEFYEEAKSIFNKASMNLREWASNSLEFLGHIPVTDKVNQRIKKVLGIQWNSFDDVLGIQCHAAKQMIAASTKREALQSLASVFDPLGLFSPLTIRAKIFINKLWKQNIDWDAEMDGFHQAKWSTIASELTNISHMKLPRFVGCGKRSAENPELLCFCDASALAYATAIYLKVSDQLSSKISLIFAKSRLPPSKAITIPRMELLAVLIGVRCLSFVEKQLQISAKGKSLWTDSQCVLHWLNSKKPLTTFVENRVKEIRQHSDVTFHYVPTNDNPADIATRGQFSYDQMISSIWWTGPSWLSSEESFWPSWPYNPEPVSSDYELRTKSADEACLASISTNDDSASPFGIDIHRFSSLLKLYRVTAWVSRFIKMMRKSNTSMEHLSSAEIAASKTIWDRYIQKTNFPLIFSSIASGKRCNLKEQLNVKLDKQDVLRCYGRFAFSDLPETARCPKLLPRKSYYTDLVIVDLHHKHLHAGTSHTLAAIRKEYWIPSGRAAVRHVLSQCVNCRRYNGGPYQIPLMPALPAPRCSIVPPFSHTGVDYLGPLIVKSQTAESQKVWICLFTCMAIRAIHLEVVEDLSTRSFLLCFRRFISRRGTPVLIISDNASHFRLAKTALERLWDDVSTDPDVQNYVSSKGVAWNFIVENAPWMGGFYERFVGLVKTASKKSIGKLRLTLPQLNTVVTEVEALVNSRPLVDKGETLWDLVTLSPADFLILNPGSGVPSPAFDDPSDPDYSSGPDSAKTILDSWAKGQKILNNFWNIWQKDYLASLRERSTYRHRQGRIVSSESPCVGQLVLIRQDGQPRASWQLGRVQGLISGEDGQVRAASLRVSSGNTVMRPINLLYPLEIYKKASDPLSSSTKSRDFCQDTIIKADDDKDNFDSTTENFHVKQRRKAAMDAKDTLHKLAMQNGI